MGFLELTRVFVTVCERGSLTAAAEQLGGSVSSISRRLTQLEDELGSVLALRTPQGVTLTAAGEGFLVHAHALLRAAEQAREVVRADGPVVGELTISSSVSWGLIRLTDALAQLHRLAPALRVNLRLDDAPSDLIAEGVDLAIRGGLPPPDSHNYRARKLASIDRLLVASPAWVEAHGEPCEPAALAELPCLVAAASASARTWTFSRERGRERVEVLVDGPLRTRTVLARKQAAVAGLGLTILPDFVCAAERSAGLLVELLDEWTPGPASIYALFRTELAGDARVRLALSVLDDPGEGVSVADSRHK